MKVVLLEHNQNVQGESMTLERGVKETIKHPNYNGNTLDNDIALLRLDQDVAFTDKLRPVCLPPPSK
jgi:hypothetical protein